MRRPGEAERVEVWGESDGKVTVSLADQGLLGPPCNQATGVLNKAGWGGEGLSEGHSRC